MHGWKMAACLCVRVGMKLGIWGCFDPCCMKQNTQQMELRATQIHIIPLHPPFLPHSPVSDDSHSFAAED